MRRSCAIPPVALAPFDEAHGARDAGRAALPADPDGRARQAPLDVGAAAAALAALSRFAWRHRDLVREIDVNPLFVLPHGAVAADALIVLSDPGAGRPARGCVTMTDE